MDTLRLHANEHVYGQCHPGHIQSSVSRFDGDGGAANKCFRENGGTMRFILTSCFILLQLHVFAGMTLIQRETFQGVGTLTASNSENLVINNGSFFKRAVGPRLTNDFTANSLGWSADVQNQAFVTQIYYPTNCVALPSGTYNSPTNAFMFDWWIWVDSVSIGGAAEQQLFFLPTAGGRVMSLETSGNAIGYPLAMSAGYGLAVNVATNNFNLPGNTWVNLRVAYRKRIDGYYGYDSSVLVRAAGATNFSEIGLFLNSTCYADPSSAISGFQGTGAIPNVRGRYGMPSVWQLDAWTNRFDLISDQVDPPSGPFTWYVNPATGNDTNDGTTAASAWQSAAKLNSEMANTGVFPSSTNVPGGGDTVIVDNTVPLYLGSNSLTIATDGLKLEFTNGPVIAYSTPSPTNWSQSSGWTNIWQTTDGGAADLTAAVVWEDDRWMNHPEGSSFASVAGTMDTNPGSFFSDGTNLYVHAFESGSPTNDGHIYTRSSNRNNGQSAVQANAGNVWVDGLNISKTCLCNSPDNDPVAAACFYWGKNSGTNILSNFSVNYWSKHGVSMVGNGNGGCAIRTNGFYGPGSPYTGFGGQSADVDYCNTGTNNTYQYWNVSCPENVGVIGAYGGVSVAQPFWLSHASSLAFDGGIFSGLNTGSVFDELGDTVQTIYITNSTFGGGSFGCNFDVENCMMTYDAPTENNPAKSGRILNSILQFGYTPILWDRLAGSESIINCDLDFRGVTGNAYVWGRAGATVFTFQNNIFIEGATSGHGLCSGFDTNDTFNFNNNLYVFGSMNILATFTNGPLGNVNFAAWQALGQDANSIVVTNPLLDSGYVPETGSAAIGNGLNLSTFFTTDYAGNPRPATGPWTIGAYQVASSTGGAGTITIVFLPAVTGSGGTLKLAWPADYHGWILQTQTNSLHTGLSTNWVDVPGSGAITQTNISVDLAKPMMFYRLRSP